VRPEPPGAPGGLDLHSAPQFDQIHFPAPQLPFTNLYPYLNLEYTPLLHSRLADSYVV
jgi:hypothetical protein